MLVLRTVMDEMLPRNQTKDMLLLYLYDMLLMSNGWTLDGSNEVLNEIYGKYHHHNDLMVSSHTVRGLASKFKTTVYTIKRWIEELENDGLIITVKGRKNYIIFVLGIFNRDNELCWGESVSVFDGHDGLEARVRVQRVLDKIKEEEENERAK